MVTWINIYKYLISLEASAAPGIDRSAYPQRCPFRYRFLSFLSSLSITPGEQSSQEQQLAYISLGRVWLIVRSLIYIYIQVRAEDCSPEKLNHLIGLRQVDAFWRKGTLQIDQNGNLILGNEISIALQHDDARLSCCRLFLGQGQSGFQK